MTTENIKELRTGVKKAEVDELLKTFKFSTEPQTIKQLVTSTGINHWAIVDHIKKNGQIVGDAPKDPGARGKAAKLYRMPASAK